MILAVIWLLSISFVVVFPFKRKPSLLLLFIIWVLFAFSSGNADFTVYERRFYNPNSEALEPLFEGAEALVRSLGGDYRTFLILCATLYIGGLYYCVRVVGRNNFLPLVLYSIFPLCIDIVQVRSTLAFLPIMLGSKFIFSNSRTSDLKYILCVAISTLIHSSGVFYIILLIAKKLSYRSTIIFTTVSSVIFSFLKNKPDLLISISSIFGVSDRVAVILDYSTWLDPGVALGTQRLIVLTIILSALVIILTKRVVGIDGRNLCDVMARVIILEFIFVPLTLLSVDIFRIQRYLLIFIYCISASQLNFNDLLRRQTRKKAFLVYISLFSFAFFNLYLQIVRPGLIETVVYPLINSNVLFS